MGCSLFARHYSGSRGFFPFLRVLRCFSSPACHSQPMYSAGNTRALPRVGFPIRKSRDQRLVSTSPALIAAAHVLHRLLAPRHPPCALVLLIEKNTLCVAMEFSRCGGQAMPKRKPSRRTVSQNSAALYRGRHSSRRPGCPDELSTSQTEAWHGASKHQRARSHRSNCSGIPRKEVIQPQLPLRLPCYDFTPIIDPTFDGSLPCGLGHRLRVLPTFVV